MKKNVVLLLAIRLKWQQAARTAEAISTFAHASRIVTRALAILVLHRYRFTPRVSLDDKQEFALGGGSHSLYFVTLTVYSAY
jgi:hypothetical protein